MRLLLESRKTLRLALPLMIGQLSQMLLGVADTVMVGHLGVTELAALTFASSLFHLPFVFGMGMLTAVAVLTSNRRGADDAAGVRASCRHGLLVATALGVLLFLLAWVVSAHLEIFAQPPEVTARTPGYFLILMASVTPALASIALKNHADALKRPWPPFWIFLGGVLLNIGLNWVMIYGKLGCPPLGFEGAAWATLIARTLILVAMMAWLMRASDLREWIPQRWWRRPDGLEIRKHLALGLPASAQMLFEVSAFSLAGLMMGRFGPDSMAAHQIALTLAATAFMIPLGLSMALTVRIGEAYGAERFAELPPIVRSGWLLAGGYGALGAIFFLLCGEWMAAAFIRDAGVIHLTGALLVIVGVFQIFDGLQVTSSAMLRGLQDTRVPALMGLVSYWLVGLPVGAWLAFGFHLDARGVWWGLAAGLLIACLTLGPRLHSHCNHHKNRASGFTRNKPSAIPRGGDRMGG